MVTKTVHQPAEFSPIMRFLGNRDAVFLFLALTGVFLILLAVFVQPTSLTDFTNQRTALTPLGQISICFTSGFAVLVGSRVGLIFAHKHLQLLPLAYFVWLLMELLLCVSVATLVLWAISGAGVIRLAPLAGVITLGCLSIQVVPYAISYLVYRLNESKREILALQQLIEQQSFSARAAADATVSFFNKNNHLAFSTMRSNVLYIEAADNYVNIHYLNDGREETFILLNSMKNMEQTFAGTSFVRCHRGYMVNVDNVSLMRKENLGLVLELNHTSKVIPVSKSFTDPIMRHFAQTIAPGAAAE